MSEVAEVWSDAQQVRSLLAAVVLQAVDDLRDQEHQADAVAFLRNGLCRAIARLCGVPPTRRVRRPVRWAG